MLCLCPTNVVSVFSFDSAGLQLNRAKTAQKEMESLEGDRQKADKFLRLDAAIRKKQYVLYQTHIAHSAVNVEKASSKHIIVR